MFDSLDASASKHFPVTVHRPIPDSGDHTTDGSILSHGIAGGFDNI